MANVIIIFILVIVVGASCLYIYKNKKKGIKCIGCPYANSCSSGHSCAGSVPREKL